MITVCRAWQSLALAAKELELGEMMRASNFNLSDAMCALELMDPRMDESMQKVRRCWEAFQEGRGKWWERRGAMTRVLCWCGCGGISLWRPCHQGLSEVS